MVKASRVQSYGRLPWGTGLLNSMNSKANKHNTPGCREGGGISGGESGGESGGISGGISAELTGPVSQLITLSLLSFPDNTSTRSSAIPKYGQILNRAFIDGKGIIYSLLVTQLVV